MSFFFFLTDKVATIISCKNNADYSFSASSLRVIFFLLLLLFLLFFFFFFYLRYLIHPR